MIKNNIEVNIIGAGLAGAECAYQLAIRGIKVKLFEMKPKKMTSAHKYTGFCELVCSNSLRANAINTGAGLLKEEMRRLGSLVIRAADENSVPAGGALAVDRNKFSDYITQKLKNEENIEIINEEVTEIPENGITVIAAGPLCSEELSAKIGEYIGKEYLYFFDAAAPIITNDSIDFGKAFFASRYNKGEADYINCPMTKEEYINFVNELVSADTAHLREFEDSKVFEGCMPVETMAKRGIDTLRFGPLKPVGIYDPKTNIRPYAVVQLRAENSEKTLYNLVGFQTHLKFGEQKRVFAMIPALANAEFIRYGVMHKNTFINSPALLNKYYQLKGRENIYFAGQITGVEGYIESASSGLLCAIFAACDILNKKYPEFTNQTAIGALPFHITTAEEKNFQPMNINFGIIRHDIINRNKQQKKEEIAQNALRIIDDLKKINPILEDKNV